MVFSRVVDARPGSLAPVPTVTPDQVRAQIAAWQVTAIVAVAARNSVLGDYLTVLLGPPQVAAGDVLAWPA